MRKLILASVILLTVIAASCENSASQVDRPAKSDRFVLTRFATPRGYSIYTWFDTATGKCWISLYEGGILETSREVCQ